jgi:protein SCO1/2
MMKRRARLPLARIIPLLLLTALLGCSPPPPPQLAQATLLPSPRTIAAFKLVDDQGAPFTPERLKGHWTLAFFGYTHCPDVCPTALGVLARMTGKLQADGRPATLPRGLFVSVDPQRDTPPVLARYVRYFNPDFIGATGTPAELLSFTRQLGILYLPGQGSAGDAYEIDHSAAIILFDPDGNYHALFNVPYDAATMAADFLKITEYYEATR